VKRSSFELIVTAGPTREYLDPVRFLSNPSTGKMGFALAEVAAKMEFRVTLIAGPVMLKTPRNVKRVDVVSARDMLKAVTAAVSESKGPTTVISSAAIADWRPAKCAQHKLRKSDMSDTLRLVRNPDVLKTLSRSVDVKSGRVKLVGFAAQTDRVLEEAARKCREKHLAFIVANDVTEKGSGFGVDTNRVTLLFADGTQLALPQMSKRMVARRILETVVRNNGGEWR